MSMERTEEAVEWIFDFLSILLQIFGFTLWNKNKQQKILLNQLLMKYNRKKNDWRPILNNKIGLNAKKKNNEKIFKNKKKKLVIILDGIYWMTNFMFSLFNIFK